MENNNAHIDFTFGDRGVRLINKEGGLYAQTLILGKQQRKFSFWNGMKCLYGLFFISLSISKDVVVKEQKII